MMVVHVVSQHSGYVHPYFCLVYNLDGLDSEDVMEVPCLPHGSSKQDNLFERPYQRMHSSVMARIDSQVDNDTASNVFYDVLEGFGAPMSSISPSIEPRNVTQVENRKRKKRKYNSQV